MSTIAAILDFWLGPVEERDAPAAAYRARWWKKDPALDQELRERFGGVLEQASVGDLDHWSESARGRLALVIVLDQFTRNIHRDEPTMYDNDDRALALTDAALSRNEDQQLKLAERQFLYMPLMHAEALAPQKRCVELFEQLAREADHHRDHVDYAIRHRDIIARFGRFPHRNGILGRTSTAEELEFLLKPGSSF